MTRAAKDSQYEQIVNLVEHAAASKAPMVRLTDRFAIPFTVVALAIASACGEGTTETRLTAAPLNCRALFPVHCSVRPAR